MLCCYADELKEGFFPYVKPVSLEAGLEDTLVHMCKV
jgi:hypothetical protein